MANRAMPVPITAMARYEKIADITLGTTNSEYTLPTQGGQIPSDRFIKDLVLMFEGRTTNPASGNPTGSHADAPFSIINRVKVEGYHRIRSDSETIIDLRGPDIRVLNTLYNSVALLSSPASLDLGANNTNDIRFVLVIPFVPLKLPMAQQVGWLLDAPNYNALQLTVEYGDDKSIFTGQSTAPTFSAFGSATGSPKLRVGAHFALGGSNRFRGFVPGRVFRYFSENSSDLTSTATEVRLFNLPRGHRIRSILLKTGVKASGAAITSPNVAYTTLSDTILTQLKIYRGLNKINRHWVNMYDLQAEQYMNYALAPPSGYGLLEWAPHGWDGEILDARALVAGPTGDVDLFLQGDVSGAANQAAVALYEEWRQYPVNVVQQSR